MTRVSELTTKLLDGTLSAAEVAELDALLQSDSAAEAEHLALLMLEAELRGLRTGFDLSNATLAKVQEAQQQQTADAVMRQITEAPPPAWASREPESAPAAPAAPATPARRRRWVGWAGVAACAAALLLALWLANQQPQSPTPPDELVPGVTAYAKLARKAGSVEVVSSTGEAVHADEGATLPPGFTLRTVGDDSLAVIELLRDKTRVEIEPDSVVRFAPGSTESSSKPRLFLATGQLTAAVPQRPEDRPFIVGTAVAEVFAREGIFIVSSAGPDSARVDIRRGKVDVVHTAAPKPVRLSAGGAAVVFGGLDRLDIEHPPTVDRVPKRTLPFPGPRDVTFSPDGSEVWIANARLFTRWPMAGNAIEKSFYPRRGGDGTAAFTDNKRLLFAFRGERDDRVLVRTLPDGGEHAAINARPTDPRFWTVAPDGSWLAVVDPRPNNKRVRVFDSATGEERFTREFDENITSLATTHDSKALAVGVHSPVRGIANKVVMLDARTSDRLFALSIHKKPPMALSFSPDGRFLAVGFNGTVQLWDTRSRELLRSITGFERALFCLTFSPDGERLAAGTQDGHVWIWDTNTGRHTQLIEVGSRGLRAIAFSPDGKQLATLANSVPVAVWDVADQPRHGTNLQ